MRDNLSVGIHHRWFDLHASGLAAGDDLPGHRLTADSTYTFRITAENGSIASAHSSTTVVDTLLAAPASPTIATASTTEIDLSWTAETDAATYKLERSLNGTVWQTVAASLASPAYSDTGLVAGTGYYYRVSATNAVGLRAGGFHREVHLRRDADARRHDDLLQRY